MKNKEEQTGLIGLAIGAAVIGLVSGRSQLTGKALLKNW
jgi:hypothetical protein